MDMICRSKESKLPDIVKVGALDSDYFNIDLSNGHTILLGLGELIKKPDFAELIKTHMFDHPQTDGKRLYWEGGPSFTVKEILNMLASRKK